MIRFPCLIRYKVKKNDTLSEIAKKYNVDWNKLIYRIPQNEEFRKQFPNPDQIDYITPNGKPVFVYIPTIIQWNESDIVNKVKRFLPPFPQNSEDSKPSTIAGKERELTVSRVNPLFLCAAYDVPVEYFKSFVTAEGRFIQRWTYSFTLKGRAMIDDDGRLDFGQNSTSSSTVTITKQGNKVAVDMFSRITVSYELDKAMQVGITLFDLDSINVKVSVDWPSLGMTLTKTQTVKLGGIDCKASFALTISPLISSFKMTIIEIPKGEKCGIQIGSFIKVEWWEETYLRMPARQVVPVYIPTMIVLDNGLPRMAFRYIPSPHEIENSHQHESSNTGQNLITVDIPWYKIIVSAGIVLISIWMTRLMPINGKAIMPLVPNPGDEDYI